MYSLNYTDVYKVDLASLPLTALLEGLKVMWLHCRAVVMETKFWDWLLAHSLLHRRDPTSISGTITTVT